MSNNKRKSLEALAVQRRAAKPPKGLRTIGSFREGAYPL